MQGILRELIPTDLSITQTKTSRRSHYRFRTGIRVREVAADDFLPEVAAEDLLPEVAADGPLPEVAADDPLPEVAADDPPPEDTADDSPPEVAVGHVADDVDEGGLLFLPEDRGGGFCTGEDGGKP